MSLSWLPVAIIVLFLILCISVYINIKLGLVILRIEDEVTDCLDVIDERYESISKILEIPIFFDSIEVRQVVEDIRMTRVSLLQVANSLARIQEDRVEK
tara:strand:- start:104 stop:400 length:297 start_codon:yes stop_codon:yes gene_type:complete